MNTEPKPPLSLRNPTQGHAEALMLAQRLYGPKPDEHRDRWRKDLSGRAPRSCSPMAGNPISMCGPVARW